MKSPFLPLDSPSGPAGLIRKTRINTKRFAGPTILRHKKNRQRQSFLATGAARDTFRQGTSNCAELPAMGFDRLARCLAQRLLLDEDVRANGQRAGPHSSAGSGSGCRAYCLAW
jgi:hypothetical protein